MNEFLKEYQSMIQIVSTLVFAIIANYFQLRLQVRALRRDLNGIGAKVNGIAKAQAKSDQRLSYTKGYLDGKKSKSKI